MWAIVTQLVNADKLGGWVRAGVAALFGLLIGKWPLIGTIVGPDLQAAVGVAVATAIVGLWSQVAKNFAAGK